MIASARPLLAIVAGSKVSTKLELLTSLVGKVDQLIVGGGIANTFLAAAGYKVGKSLHEADLVEAAKALMDKVEIPLPETMVTEELNARRQSVEQQLGFEHGAGVIF